MKIRNIFELLKDNTKKFLENSKRVLYSKKSSEFVKEEKIKHETEIKNDKILKQTINPDSKIFTNLNIDINRETQNEPGTQKKFSDIDRESESNMIAGQMQSTQAEETDEKDLKKNMK